MYYASGRIQYSSFGQVKCSRTNKYCISELKSNWELESGQHFFFWRNGKLPTYFFRGGETLFQQGRKVPDIWSSLNGLVKL